MSWRGILFAAILLGVAIRAIGMYSLPLVDPSEGRYAASAAEILRSGEWLVPQVFVQGAPVPYLGKPPLQLWSSALAMKVGGMHPFWLRLPSFLAVLLMLLFMYRVLRRFEGEDFALLATALCATAPGFLVLMGIGMPDTLLSAAVAASYIAYYAFLQEESPALKKRWSLLIFLFAALGFMCKGPIALLWVGLPALVWTVRWRRWDTILQHAWVLGVPMFLLITAPWFILCERAHPGFIQYFFINENLLRFTQSEFGDRFGQSHHQYFGAAIAFAIALALPWSLWASVLAIRPKTRPAFRSVWQAPGLSYLLLVALANVAFLCLSRNYLPTYLLPLVPAIAIAAAAILRAAEAPLRRVAQLALACVLLVGAATVIVPIASDDFSSYKVGKLALAEAARVGAPPKICWIRKVPNSAFFYFRDVLVVPPYADELAEALPWFLENTGYTYIAQKKHLRVLPPEFQARLEPLNEDGRWVIFRIKAPV